LSATAPLLAAVPDESVKVSGLVWPKQANPNSRKHTANAATIRPSPEDAGCEVTRS
jgi:hypothetical protein